MAEKKTKTETPKVITLAEIKERAKGKVIEIPDWIPGQTIAVRVRAVDLTPHIMQMRAILNPLKTAALEAFEGNVEEKLAEELMNEENMGGTLENIERMMPMIDAIIREALVEPSFDEIEKIMPLTLDQKLAIFDWAMAGINSLRSFRK